MKRLLYQLSYSGKKKCRRGVRTLIRHLFWATYHYLWQLPHHATFWKTFCDEPDPYMLSSSSQYRGCVLDFRLLSWCSRKYSATLPAFAMKAASSDAASLMPHRPASVVPRAGVEPAASEGQRLLRPPRLPISPSGLILC